MDEEVWRRKLYWHFQHLGFITAIDLCDFAIECPFFFLFAFKLLTSHLIVNQSSSACKKFLQKYNMSKWPNARFVLSNVIYKFLYDYFQNLLSSKITWQNCINQLAIDFLITSAVLQNGNGNEYQRRVEKFLILIFIYSFKHHQLHRENLQQWLTKIKWRHAA